MATAASSKKKPKAMNKKSLQHFEKRLLEERKRVLKELGHYDETFGSTPQGADGDLSAYSFHMADQGTDAMEREKAFLFASQEGRFLWHIDEALRRLYRNPEQFGKCHNCGREISFERLDALPHARYCIECKQREEDENREAYPAPLLGDADHGSGGRSRDQVDRRRELVAAARTARDPG